MRTEELPIASPCGADWRTMKPSDKKRFCDACQKHVHDLSALTEGEARAVLHAPPAEGLCVRYLHDRYGNIVFQPTPIPPGLLSRAKRAAASAAGAAALALPLSLNACMGAAPAPPPRMGAVACPLPSASAAAPVLIPTMGEPAMVPPAASGHPATQNPAAAGPAPNDTRR